MSIGTRVRFYRLKNKLSLEDLANGITTVSYLSSIENNEHTPPIEMLSQLCDQLEIPFMTYQNKELSQFIEDWKHYLLINDKENSSIVFQEMGERLSDSTDIIVILTYNVYLIRYYLLHDDLKMAQETIDLLSPFLIDMADDLKFSYQKFRGNFFYLKEKFLEAEPYFKDAKNYLIAVKELYNLEKADLFYMYGLTLARTNKNTLSIFYIEDALSLYQQSYNMKRCTDCHLLLGMVYRRMQDYKEAQKHYYYAKQLAISLDYKNLIDKVENNLGYLKAQQGKSEEAIHHYLKSLDHSELAKIEDKVNTIINIMKEYYKIGFKDQVEKWLNEGLDILKTNDQFQEVYKEQFIELMFYHYVVHDYPPGFETFMLDNAIPYFESTKKYHGIILYSKTLGDYYQQKYDYKSAATSFANANSAYEKIINF
jgi:HTH-type transcriptional regulator, quorum sensing regulator NprR